jgi:hypothetical protein
MGLFSSRDNFTFQLAQSGKERGGRPRKLSVKDIQVIKALMGAGELPVQHIADRFGVSTLYRNAARPEVPEVLEPHAI